MSRADAELIEMVRGRMVRAGRMRRLQSTILMSSIAALVLTVILRSLNVAPLPAAGAMIAAALIGGVVWAAAVGVPMAAAATLIDQQFELKDLLGTVTMMEELPSGDAAWQQSLRSMAEACCREINPGDIRISMVGKPVWSAIALVLGMTVGLGVWPGQQVNSTGTLPQVSTDLPAPAANSSDRRSSATIDRPRPPGNNNLDEPANRAGPTEATSVDSANIGAGSRGATASSSDKSSGSSSGMGRTAATISPIADSSAISGISSATPLGRGGGGGAAGDASGQNISVNSGLQSPHAPSVFSSPPWQSPNWPAAQSSADQAIRSNAVDPAYRDFVRDYFTRP
jgi:hypothetical protein